MGSTSPPQAANGSESQAEGVQNEELSSTDNNNAVTVEDNTSSTDNKQEEDDGNIDALTATFGNVSIAPNQSAPSTIQRVAKMLASNKYKKIVVLTGAGVSCNAGIPDFRTPGSGLYDNLQKYNLPFPEAVFDLGFYRRNPSPFVQLASELWPGLKHSPTMTHSFIALLEKKGMLLRTYTQNIDMLDVLAGVSEERMIECHGHFRTASCTVCSNSFDGEECKRLIVEEKRAPSCVHCKGHVKPDIVFFGEGLPDRFHKLVKKDVRDADLLIVMGTSLMVSPVCQIPDMVRRDCPRVLFNRELVGSFCRGGGMKSRRKSYDNIERDIFHEGDCDETIRLLCSLLGWEGELVDLNSSTRL
jgi:NAD-dependent SIR2 family protein deacetylase